MRRIFYVLGGHIFLLVLLCLRPPIQHQLKVTHHLVDTHHLVCDTFPTPTSVMTAEVIPHLDTPVQIEPQIQNIPAPLPPPPIQTKPPPPKQTAKAKPTTAVKPNAKPQPLVQSPPKGKPTPHSQHQALAALMEKSLKTLDSPKTLSKAPSAQKVSLGSLHADRLTCSYQDQLVALLEGMLMFPEVGDVSVEISVLPSGKISSCKVLKSLSAANQAYVLQTLPSLTLPPCTDLKKGESSKTLRLTLLSRNQH